MVLAIVMLVGGAAVLAMGAEGAIRGAARLARARGIPPFVLGALLFGIDVESLGAALVAAGTGQTALAAGEAFGTIVFLLAVAFGVALLLAPGPVPAPRTTMVLLPGLTLLGGALTLADQVVTRFEGGALLGLYLVYVGAVLLDGREPMAMAREIEREAEEGPRLPPLVLLLGGLAIVYVGASVLVGGGVRLLARTSLAAGFVGAAIIGALAAMDEVLLEVMPMRRGMSDLATGNLFGTIAAFSTGVLGLAALVRPLVLDSAATSAYLAATVLYAVVAVTFLARGHAGKPVGLLVLVLYAVWIALAWQMR